MWIITETFWMQLAWSKVWTHKSGERGLTVGSGGRANAVSHHVHFMSPNSCPLFLCLEEPWWWKSWSPSPCSGILCLKFSVSVPLMVTYWSMFRPWGACQMVPTDAHYLSTQPYCSLENSSSLPSAGFLLIVWAKASAGWPVCVPTGLTHLPGTFARCEHFNS